MKLKSYVTPGISSGCTKCIYEMLCINCFLNKRRVTPVIGIWGKDPTGSKSTTSQSIQPARVGPFPPALHRAGQGALLFAGYFLVHSLILGMYCWPKLVPPLSPNWFRNPPVAPPGYALSPPAFPATARLRSSQQGQKQLQSILHTSSSNITSPHRPF